VRVVRLLHDGGEDAVDVEQDGAPVGRVAERPEQLVERGGGMRRHAP